MASRTLIIGCGYAGLPLALLLKDRGHQVTAWVRSAESAGALAAHAFSRIIVGSVADENRWKALGEKIDLVIHCASSGRGGVDAYEEVFLRGARLMNVHRPGARRLLVSSTSVYGQTQGEIVTEESPAEPASATSRILRETEKESQVSDVTIVRSSGIYGPGRSVLFEKFRRGEAVIESDGLRWINQIQQRDLVAALAHLIDAGLPGEIYNATDNTPVSHLEFYTWCAEFLQKPLPPFGPVNLERKRGLTNKRVSNARLRATGWSPIYPSFREGLKADGSGGR